VAVVLLLLGATATSTQAARLLDEELPTAAIPAIPGVPGVPAVGPGIPVIPGVPGVPVVGPGIPFVPVIPGVPVIVPIIPGVPMIAGMTTLPVPPFVPPIDPGAGAGFPGVPPASSTTVQEDPQPPMPSVVPPVP
jgi:hypothetical protein